MIYRIHLPDGTYSTIVADQAFIDAHFPGAAALGLSEEQLGTLFIAAKELQL